MTLLNIDKFIKHIHILHQYIVLMGLPGIVSGNQSYGRLITLRWYFTKMAHNLWWEQPRIGKTVRIWWRPLSIAGDQRAHEEEHNLWIQRMIVISPLPRGQSWSRVPWCPARWRRGAACRGGHCSSWRPCARWRWSPRGTRASRARSSCAQCSCPSPSSAPGFPPPSRRVLKILWLLYNYSCILVEQ